jgi:modulator of FtsH protease HflK
MFSFLQRANFSWMRRPIAFVAYPFLWIASKFRQRATPLVPNELEMSMNDPQWGKRPGGNNNGGGDNNKNEGPPDLDEMLRKLNQKLGSLFGNKGGGSTGGSGGPSKAMMGGGLLLGIGLVIAVWLATGFYQIDQRRKGVELRFGKFTQMTGPGLHWRIPYPIETVEEVTVEELRAIEIGYRHNQKKMPAEALMVTEDQNIVDMQFAVQYKIADTESAPRDYLFSDRRPDESVRQVAETAMREIVGKSKMDFVLYEGRTDISVRAKQLMQTMLDEYKTGITVTSVNMQNAQPPEQVQKSFNDVVSAKQIRKQLINEGQAYADAIVPRAKGTASRLMEEAEGHKQRVIANATGEASRFSAVLTEYEKAPGVTRERIYLDVMQRILQNTTKVVVDQKGGQNLLYLPLDKIMEMSGSSQAVADATSRAAQNNAPAASLPTIKPEITRDLRARDNRQ